MIALGTVPADGAVGRLILRYRPRICPFDRVLGRVPEGSAVLDVGCGAGLLYALLAAERGVTRYHGFDVQRVKVEAAASALGRDGVVFETRDLAEPWPNGPFDVVTMIDVMHHLPDALRRPAIEKAASALRPGGRLVYKDIAADAPLRKRCNRLHDLAMARQWTREQPLVDVEAWAEAAGLTTVARESIAMLWYPHELRVFAKPADADRPG